MDIILDSNFQVTPKLLEQIIDSVISKYGTDQDFEYGSLRDSISPMYKLFAYLKNAENENQMILFYYIFYGIYTDKFRAEDIIRYHINRNINISDESLEEFLQSISTDSEIYTNYKKSMIKEAFHDLIFKDFYNYFETSFNKEHTVTTETIETATGTITKEYNVKYQNYLNVAEGQNNVIGTRVIAKIDPTDIYCNNAYPNYNIAIQEYFKILKDYLCKRAGIVDSNGFSFSNYTFTKDNSYYEDASKTKQYAKHLTTLTTLNTLFNTGDTSSGECVIPEPYFLYQPNIGNSNIIYNRDNSDKLSKSVQLANQNPELNIDWSIFNSIIEDIVDNIMKAIDDHNNSIWMKYISLGDQIYSLETRLRQLQVPKNIFSLYNSNVQEFISDVKNTCISLFRRHEQNVETETFNAFNAVSYIYGVDFVIELDPILSTTHYQNIYKNIKYIYTIDGTHAASVGQLTDYTVPLQYDINFTAYQFINDDMACIYVKRDLVLEKYRDIIDKYGYYTVTDGKFKGFNNLDLYTIQNAVNDDALTTDKNDNPIDKNDFLKNFIPQNIFRETPYLWKENIDFESEYFSNSFKGELDESVDNDAVKNLIDNYYCFKIYVNNTERPYRTRNGINFGIGDYIRDKLVFEYSKTYSFFKSTGNSIEIHATDDYGSENVRSLYNLTSYVSKDRERMYQGREVQNKTREGNKFIYNSISKLTTTDNTVISGIVNASDAVGQFFHNIGTGVANIVDTIGNVIDFIPERITQGTRTDDLLQQMINIMWTTLEGYRDRSVKYSNLNYLGKRIIDDISSDWETDNDDGLSAIYIDAQLYIDLIITPLENTIKNIISNVINLEEKTELKISNTNTMTTYEDTVRLQKSALAMELSKQSLFPKVIIPAEDVIRQFDYAKYRATSEDLEKYVIRLDNLFAVTTASKEDLKLISDYDINFQKQLAYREDVMNDLQVIKFICDDFINYLTYKGHFIKNTWEVT